MMRLKKVISVSRRSVLSCLVEAVHSWGQQLREGFQESLDQDSSLAVDQAEDESSSLGESGQTPCRQN